MTWHRTLVRKRPAVPVKVVAPHWGTGTRLISEQKYQCVCLRKKLCNINWANIKRDPFSNSWFCFWGLLEEILMLECSKNTFFFTYFTLLQHLFSQSFLSKRLLWLVGWTRVLWLVNRLKHFSEMSHPFTISVSFNTLMQLKVMCTFPGENSRLQLMHYRESRNSVHW